MIIYFDSTTGEASTNYLPNTTELSLPNNYFLKSTLLPVPGTLIFYPQIIKHPYLNIVFPEKYYQNINNELVKLNNQSLNFPLECRFK